LSKLKKSKKMRKGNWKERWMNERKEANEGKCLQSPVTPNSIYFNYIGLSAVLSCHRAPAGKKMKHKANKEERCKEIWKQKEQKGIKRYKRKNNKENGVNDYHCASNCYVQFV
jgi:hypothetical protein